MSENSFDNKDYLELKPPLIARGDSFDFKFATFTESEGGEKFSEWLNKKRSKVSDTGQSYRVINHWDEKGVISANQDDEGGWRRFSVFELVWLEIVRQLREFGFPLDKIKEVRHCFTESEFAEYEKKIFEFYISLTLNGEDCVFVVLPQGRGYFATKSELDSSLSLGLIKQQFISIYLNHVLQNIFEDTDFDIDNPSLRHDLNSSELKIMEKIRSGDFNSIKIVLDEGSVERLESEKLDELDNFSDLINKIKEYDYQDIELETADGQTQYMRQIIKEKL